MSWIRYILVPVTRIELGGSNGGIWSEDIFSTILRKMAQPETGRVRTTENEGNTLEMPSDGMGPSVCRQEDRLIWKRKFSHLRVGGGGGHQATEPQMCKARHELGLRLFWRTM